MVVHSSNPMGTLNASSIPQLGLTRFARGIVLEKPSSRVRLNRQSTPSAPLLVQHKELKFRPSTALSSTVSTESRDPLDEEEKFDWYAQWYPVMPICDLDKRKPHGMKVMGLDIVVWWDRNQGAWKVFDDSCPHRLAPLSEGRIDQWGRLQCVYHGWCFSGSGDCKLIPQAPRDGPPVHSSKRACATVYPSCVQNDILWFWPNADRQCKDIFLEKKPPYIPEMDDASFTKLMMTRDIPYGYEVMIENLMDPAHVPYAHYGIMRISKPPKSVKADREGGRPLEISVTKVDKNGFTADQENGSNMFVPPCLFYAFLTPGRNPKNQAALSAEMPSSKAVQKRFLLVFFCIPVSPGCSRLIFTSPRNFGLWIDQIVPRWIFHIGQNLILDSDLYLLHVEERKLKEHDPFSWHKLCFVPTKADALVVAFRRWLNNYGGGEVGWRTNLSRVLPPTPPREQLLDRYWSHTVNCTSCSLAYKSLSILEIMLQIVSIISIGVVAAAKQNLMPMATRNALAFIAVLSYIVSKWLAIFIYKNFRFHDYNHAFR